MFFLQAEDGIRDRSPSRGLGDVYKRQLLDLMVSPEGIKYNAKSNNQSRCFFLMFNDWWNEIIFDDKKNKFTRRDIVTYVANQDGERMLILN